MRITFIKHSGFSVETDEANYVFDYVKGNLPAFSEDKPFYVFASHAHQDHWVPGIFTHDVLKKARLFILGFDIKAPFEKMAAEDPSLNELPIVWAWPQQPIETEHFKCTPLLSTDEGVAFPVLTEKETFYHAGDLNWWHWNGDPYERNRERAVNYKREIDRMKGIHFDVAFVPLDPRQEDAYRFCMDYFMETVDADHVFPMHFWKKYELCKTYQESLKEKHPDWYQRFIPLAVEGECYSF